MKNSIFSKLATAVAGAKRETLTVEEYLEEAKVNPSVYATPHQRLLTAIGEPTIIDTSQHENLNIIFGSQKIRTYAAFSGHFGIYADIDMFVNGYLVPAAQGLEARKQIVLFEGHVGCGKSTFVERCKQLFETQPMYILATTDGVLSPLNDNPLGLFLKQKKEILEAYGIHSRFFPAVLSPWAIKRLREYGGDITKFRVVKVFPSESQQLGIAKTEPLDDNNADISTLIGKAGLRKLQMFDENDPDVYNYTGGLCIANRGILEMAEIYKTNIKTLGPLLDGTTMQSYQPLENIGSFPFDGIILAHCNKSEASKFRADKKNEALVDRTRRILFHYPLQWSEDVKILDKFTGSADLKDKPIAPRTKEFLSKFAIMTRIEELEESNLWSKMRVYNGENIKSEDTKALPYTEYKALASQNEGTDGVSTRQLFTVLADTYNTIVGETSADVVTLFKVLKKHIVEAQYDPALETKYMDIVENILEPKYLEEITPELQRAYIENSGFAQAKFDNYVQLARAYVQNKDYPDPETGVLMDRDSIHRKLQELEKLAGIPSYESFRNDIVIYVLEQQAAGKKVVWSSYKKLAQVIEKSVFKDMRDILPIISFTAKQSKDDEAAHKKFLNNMTELGYTPSQIKRLVAFYSDHLHT